MCDVRVAKDINPRKIEVINRNSPISRSGGMILAYTFITQDFAIQHVHESLVVSDAMAYATAVFLLERAKVLPELAAACTLAAFEGVAERFGPADHVVLVLCGGNVSVADLVDYRQRFDP